MHGEIEAVAGEAWQIRSAIRTQLVALAAAQRSAATLARQRALNDEIVDMLEKRLAAGEASAPEVTQARAEQLAATTAEPALA